MKMSKQTAGSVSCLLAWSAVTVCLVLIAATLTNAQEVSDKPLDDVGDVPRLGRKALFQTQKYRDEGNWDESARILLETIEKYPNQDHFLLRFHLAISLDQAGRADEALHHYQEAVRLEPRFAQGWLNLGELAYNQQKYELAGEAFQEGFKHQDTDPPNVDLLYYAAACYVSAENHARAAEVLENLVSGNHGQPKLEWYRALVASYLELEDKARGDAAIQKALNNFPGDPDAWYLAFQFAASQDDYRRASVALTIVGYLRPLTSTESVTLGDLYTAVGVPAMASNYYELAMGEDASAEEYERLASAYLAAYRSAESLHTLERALQKQPTVRLWSLLGDQHYIDENYAASYAAYQKCVELDPDYGRAYLMMGYCAMEMVNLPEAVTLLEKATQYPEQAETAAALLARARHMAANSNSS